MKFQNKIKIGTSFTNGNKKNTKIITNKVSKSNSWIAEKLHVKPLIEHTKVQKTHHRNKLPDPDYKKKSEVKFVSPLRKFNSEREQMMFVKLILQIRPHHHTDNT